MHSTLPWWSEARSRFRICGARLNVWIRCLKAGMRGKRCHIRTAERQRLSVFCCLIGVREREFPTKSVDSNEVQLKSKPTKTAPLVIAMSILLAGAALFAKQPFAQSLSTETNRGVHMATQEQELPVN